MQAAHSVSIDAGEAADGSACFFIKLQAADCEVNITASARELEELRGVSGARWLNRRSLRAGRCLDAPAYWSCEQGRLSVLVGPDDEFWEVGFSAPESLVDALLAEIERVEHK